MSSGSGPELREADDQRSRPGSGRLAVINGLRGLAIIGVVFNHLVASIFTKDSLLSLSPALSALLANGWSGVNLFFILSGFVLFLPHAADEGGMTRLADHLAFYRRRCRRLLPMFYVGTIGSWAFAVGGGMPGDPSQLLSVLSFGFILDARSFAPSFNITLWSLGDEIAFSALFPLLVLGLRRYGVIHLAALVLGVALVTRLVGISNDPTLGPTFNSNMFVCRLDEFVIGMVLAHAYVAGWLPRSPALWACGGVALVVLAWAGFDLVLRDVALPPICRALLNDVLDAGLCVIIVAALDPQTRLAAGLSWRPLQVAGVMCYSLYIWHWPLLWWIAPDRALMSAPACVGAITAFLGLTFVVAALSYRFIEFPRAGAWRQLFLLPPPHAGRSYFS
jgi:peptidoglycan/LPS O-acetylase OafA/YrhL